MDTNYEKFISSLPAEMITSDSQEAAMNELLASLSGKKVPTSRLARLWAISTTQMSIAIANIGAWSRGILSSDEKKTLLNNEARMRAAIKVLGTMGYLRGAMSKLGQALAAYPGVGTEQMSTVLSSLNFEAPPMHFSLLREQVENELGGDPMELFAEFDKEPFAAASLGQVHRARLKTGEDVAVKIQYPNIASAIRADFANIKLLMNTMRLSKEWRFMVSVIEDIQATFLVETDYRREAEFAERARQILSDFDDIVVPRIHPGLSSEHVLTMDYLEGDHLTAFLEKSLQQEICDKAGEKLMRAMFRLFYSGRMVHADPNEGNFLFLSDGRLGLLDFGCCRIFDDEEWDYFCAGTKDFLASGTPSDAIIKRGALLSDKEMQDEDRIRILRSTVDWQWEPLHAEGDFTFDEDYMKRGVEGMVELMRKRYTRTSPINTWTNRMFYGVRILLCRLNATFNAAATNRAEVERAGLLD